ncbi:RHS repeat domain-containing protein [Methylogaea oryzae]|uniref:RHS repeat domain-containing protein n=1 Tax=Methylogaea oryzae TaxID=1295382 RepID=UPI001C3F329B|nr:RHS repeat-associated core domain-containing protein [Methylogaea oryzae]
MAVAAKSDDDERPAGLYDIHTDHLGAPRALLDQDNQIAWTWHSDPYGAAWNGERGKITYNLRLPGQYYDRETGLHYNYFRDYDPGTGRYIESDPIGLKGGVNTYAYVGNNPIHWIDPLGLERKPGKTPPNSWPTPPIEACGKKPKWSPSGYWEGKKGRNLTGVTIPTEQALIVLRATGRSLG